MHQSRVATLDLHRESSAQVPYVVQSVYNGILMFHPDGSYRIVPDLAESWTSSEDGRTITFRLRSGIKFHDGAPLTADDAIFSLNRQMNPPRGMPSPRGGILQSVVERIEKVNDLTFVVRLKYPSASFLNIVASGWMAVMPKRLLEKNNDALVPTAVGTGPFKLKRFEVGAVTVAERNPDYWNKGLPYLDGYQMLFVPDQATRWAAMRTKRVQISGLGSASLQLDEVASVARDKLDIAIVDAYSNRGYGLVFNHARKPFNDVRVRRAFALASDPQEVIQVAFQGEGLMIGLIGYPRWGTPADQLSKFPGYRKPGQTDLDEAKRLLREAGYGSGLKVTALMRTTAIDRRVMPVVQQQVGRVGIDLALQPLEIAPMFERYEQQNFDTGLIAISEPIDDPDVLLRNWYHTQGTRNYGKFSDPEIDRLLEEQSKIAEFQKRNAVVMRAEQLLMEKVAALELTVAKYSQAYWKNLEGYRPYDIYNSWRYDWAYFKK